MLLYLPNLFIKELVIMENVPEEKYIELICNGEFNAVPDFKIGE